MAVLKIKKNGEWFKVGIGAQGKQGEAGTSATINGVTALVIEASGGIKATQDGSTLTLTLDAKASDVGAPTVEEMNTAISNAIGSIDTILDEINGEAV